MVVVFHRDETLHFGGLVCYRTTTFPSGVVRVPSDDEALDNFAPFIAGFVIQDSHMDKAIRVEWRKICRALGNSKDEHSHELVFSSPSVMVVFTQHATKLSELTAQVPLLGDPGTIKNSMARLRLPVPIVRPREIRQVQQCVRWALKYDLDLTVLGGGHSGHCLLRNVVSVDMSALDQIHFVPVEDSGEPVSNTGSLIIVEAGCKTGDIVSKTMTRGMTLPLGSRPSVGAGLWLQGDIGHLARLHGLPCDAIVGAVLVSAESGQILCVGNVQERHQPAEAVRPEHEDDLLWAMRGAGTNFGIVVSVIFMAYSAPTYLTRWIVPLSNGLEAQRRLGEFDERIAKRISANYFIDVYLYWNTGHLHLGVTLIQSQTTDVSWETFNPVAAHLSAVLGSEDSSRVVNGVGLFETEMYMSGMHGGHGGGKTSAFKRCLFLKTIGTVSVIDVLVAAIHARPSHLRYLHIMQDGGAVADVALGATAFGCRDWDFACVITGVWSRDQDGTEAARDAVQWVYKVAGDLLPFSSGVYGADLGPDPRDAALAAQAFGLNRSRLARLKHSFDPHNILAYACPLPKVPREPKLIILVTGKSCVGKDYCAGHWATLLTRHHLKACVASISDSIKREYAARSGADWDRLLRDRAYKERHRPALTALHKQQVQQRPWLPETRFLQIVHGAPGIDVLLITGMRDESPVAAFSHLVPYSRLLEVRVKASEDTRRVRREYHRGNDDGDQSRCPEGDECGKSNVTSPDCRPSLIIFSNDVAGNVAAGRFAEASLLPFFHEDLQQLADMVGRIPDFPRTGIEFRHVLDTYQQPGGLPVCTSLLQSHYTGDWAKVDLLISCEAGGFVYGSALAERVNRPLALVREAGKLPPPTVSIVRYRSHISSLASDDSKEQCFEMSRNVVPTGGCVVVVDDVLATGRTLCAVLSLLAKAGIDCGNISVITVAEFPVHRGRDLLRRFGFGRVRVQSLLVFGCA